MDSKEIKELLTYILNTGLDEVYIKTDHITIRTKKTPSLSSDTKINLNSKEIEDIIEIKKPKLNITKTETTEKETKQKTAYENEVIFRSPMIGTFYDAPNPESEPFVKSGDIITKGQTLCIIEAMKLFNEIESDISGTIKKVLVNDSSPVEFDQPLFVIETQ